jgi:plasmid stabilization system protein ParE
VTRLVQWSRDALDDLKRQIAYIAADDVGAAQDIADRLGKAAASLAERPTGRPGRVGGTYEKSVGGLPYIIAYAITTRGNIETISILRVIHTSRDWPAGRWPT